MNTYTLLAVTAAFAFNVTAGALQAAEPGQLDFQAGTFTGASDHITTGGVTLIPAEGGGGVVLLDADFTLDGAPDPWVSLGTDGAEAPLVNLGVLGELAGQQAFSIPASVDLTDVDQVLIWCEQFSVPLGIADLD